MNCAATFNIGRQFSGDIEANPDPIKDPVDGIGIYEGMDWG